jgi:hypothetical protein
LRVSYFSFLDEFNLLRETGRDIQEKPWTKPAIRETMHQHLRIEHAREEITENEIFACVLSELHAANSPIYTAVYDHCLRRRRVNHQLLAQIDQIHSLEGFSGEMSVGVRAGSSVGNGPSASDDVDATELYDASGEEDIAEDDLVERDLNALVDYISDLSLCADSFLYSFTIYMFAIQSFCASMYVCDSSDSDHKTLCDVNKHIYDRHDIG